MDGAGDLLAQPAWCRPRSGGMSMIFQSYAIWPNMTVARERRLRPAGAQAAARPRCARGVDEILDVVQLRAAEGPLSGRAVGRPAAARGAGARHRGRARGAAARRAAVQPRRQPARGDALRDPPPARRVPDHHGLRHARPGRGDGDLRPHRGDEPGPHRADRRAARALRRPQSRFVAGFIGRTNFVEGAQGSDVLRRLMAAARGRAERLAIGLSARRQSAGRRANGGAASRPRSSGRAYLGEYWDYQVRPLGEAKPLRVSTGPNTVFEIGSRVWLEIDPAAMVRVE